jgi:hypothetical protein
MRAAGNPKAEARLCKAVQVYAQRLPRRDAQVRASRWNQRQACAGLCKSGLRIRRLTNSERQMGVLTTKVSDDGDIMNAGSPLESTRGATDPRRFGQDLDTEPFATNSRATRSVSAEPCETSARRKPAPVVNRKQNRATVLIRGR